MATSLPMAANNHHHQPTNPTLPQQNHDQPYPPIQPSSGKRKTKSGGNSAAGQKKKRPQKGMSVEKAYLEFLLSGRCLHYFKAPNGFVSSLLGLCQDCYKGMKGVAVHRKLGGTFGSEGRNDHVLMEYEFFPPSSRIDDDEVVDDLVMMNTPKKVTSETSSVMAGFDHAAAASNKCIDLSLKLSYY